ncbi:MAG: hypothetical protein OH316_01280 [Candidatus Parvarchaeota archaeon]|nr:hypothetical protein [Candidatus Parvarchaeota archaeon]MCW1301750.1 hypothetical protein [Candidatus Parvarchaeota archaeon]
MIHTRRKSGYGSGGLRRRFNNFIDSIPREIRYTLIAFFSLAIGIANWNKDFAIRRVVILPFLYKNFYTLGIIWYVLAFALELFSIVSIISLGKNREKTIPLGFVYELASSVNFWMFLGVFNGIFSKFRYEIVWNGLFFLFQLPVFIVILLYSFGAIGRKSKNRNI